MSGKTKIKAMLTVAKTDLEVTTASIALSRAASRLENLRLQLNLLEHGEVSQTVEQALTMEWYSIKTSLESASRIAKKASQAIDGLVKDE